MTWIMDHFKIVSILKTQERDYSWIMGGGTMKQKYMWSERYLSLGCEDTLPPWPGILSLIRIENFIPQEIKRGWFNP